MTAPLIVHSAGELREDRQEVVLMLHDFTFRTPQEVLAGLTGTSVAAAQAMAQKTEQAPNDERAPNVPEARVVGMAGGAPRMAMPGMTVSGMPSEPGMTVSGVPGLPGMMMSDVPELPGSPGSPGVPGIKRQSVAGTNAAGSGVCAIGMDCATAVASSASADGSVMVSFAPLSSSRSLRESTFTLTFARTFGLVRTTVYPLGKMSLLNCRWNVAVDVLPGLVKVVMVPSTYVPEGMATLLPTLKGSAVSA